MVIILIFQEDSSDEEIDKNESNSQHNKVKLPKNIDLGKLGKIQLMY